MLHRFGSRPDRLSRSMTGDHLLAGLRRHRRQGRRRGRTRGPPTGRCCPTPGCSTSAAATAPGFPSTTCSVAWPRSTATSAAAVGHARDAVALARVMPSPPLLVHCLDHLADHLQAVPVCAPLASLRLDPATVPPVTSGRPTRPHRCASRPTCSPPPSESGGRAGTCPHLRKSPAASAGIVRDGDLWILSTPLGNARLPDSTGVAQLARLLRSPVDRTDCRRALGPFERPGRR